MLSSTLLIFSPISRSISSWFPSKPCSSQPLKCQNTPRSSHKPSFFFLPRLRALITTCRLDSSIRCLKGISHVTCPKANSSFFPSSLQTLPLLWPISHQVSNCIGSSNMDALLIVFWVKETKQKGTKTVVYNLYEMYRNGKFTEI